MASVFNETFDSITAGQTITISNTVFNLITIGASATFTAIAGAKKLGGARVTTVSAGANGRQNWAAPASSRYIRVYIRIPANPATNMGIMSIRLSSTIQANIQISPTGNLRLRNGTTLVSTSTNTLPLNAWVRLEWFWNAAASTQTLRLFSGANVNSPSTYTEQITGAANNVTADNTNVGILDPTANATLDIDEYALDDATWVGPIAVTQEPWIKYAKTGTWHDVIDHHASGGVW